MGRADDQPSTRTRTALPAILVVLFATGWAANHFTALLPILAQSEGLGRTAIDGAFGIYAVGLLPGLLGGGTLSDRWGRRPLLLTGAAVAGLGNLALLCWHDQSGVFIGRLIVGAGVGVAMSAGTAWSADIGGGSGSVLAGVSLTAGFGCGPVISALLAQFTAAPVDVPFAVSVGLSATAVLTGAALARTAGAPESPASGRDVSADAGSHQGVVAALGAALPLAVWVFASATTAMVTMVERMHYRFDGPLLPGMAAALTLSSGVVIQMVARRREWGSSAGAAGALAAAIGFGTVAAAGATPSVAVFVAVALVLGIAYGLCLRQGLVDVETLSPPRLRGTLTGIFWAVTYLGFGLPVLLVTIEPAVGITAPTIVLSVVAVAVAVLRVVRGSSAKPAAAHTVRDEADRNTQKI
ncbi:putative drug resistance transporter [uncultured Mycobacterium sp.]|uniref:Putative drug resistance transporter n=1 Tax=uncultured Mycobacterium sp. TaxID=171292 RepID=A0A1Y5PFJ2_9MYCO|nr:putative drug resistance transporter [uncultured Mycobacterium sp.]